MSKIYLNECGIICALGEGQAQVKAQLYAGQPGVGATSRWSKGRELALGAVRGELPSVAHLPAHLRSRNNALALAAVAQIRPAVQEAVARYGAGRVGVVLGTSTSGIGETEQALGHHVASGMLPEQFSYRAQEMGSPAELLAMELGLEGPAYVHSTACSSAAKAMASAARMTLRVPSTLMEKMSLYSFALGLRIDTFAATWKTRVQPAMCLAIAS